MRVYGIVVMVVLVVLVVIVVIVMLVVREGLDLDMRGARRGGCYLIAIASLIGSLDCGIYSDCDCYRWGGDGPGCTA